jgi:hypothetical protein
LGCVVCGEAVRSGEEVGRILELGEFHIVSGSQVPRGTTGSYQVRHKTDGRYFQCKSLPVPVRELNWFLWLLNYLSECILRFVFGYQRDPMRERIGKHSASALVEILLASDKQGPFHGIHADTLFVLMEENDSVFHYMSQYWDAPQKCRTLSRVARVDETWRSIVLPDRAVVEKLRGASTMYAWGSLDGNGDLHDENVCVLEFDPLACERSEATTLRGDADTSSGVNARTEARDTQKLILRNVDYGYMARYKHSSAADFCAHLRHARRKLWDYPRLKVNFDEFLSSVQYCIESFSVDQGGLCIFNHMKFDAAVTRNIERFNDCCRARRPLSQDEIKRLPERAMALVESDMNEAHLRVGGPQALPSQDAVSSKLALLQEAYLMAHRLELPYYGFFEEYVINILGTISTNWYCLKEEVLPRMEMLVEKAGSASEKWRNGGWISSDFERIARQPIPEPSCVLEGMVEAVPLHSAAYLGTVS